MNLIYVIMCDVMNDIYVTKIPKHQVSGIRYVENW